MIRGNKRAAQEKDEHDHHDEYNKIIDHGSHTAAANACRFGFQG
jgi:hypothetical protein